jgi:hypothetical protein
MFSAQEELCYVELVRLIESDTCKVGNEGSSVLSRHVHREIMQ